jgi:hypothetical protein
LKLSSKAAKAIAMALAEGGRGDLVQRYLKQAKSLKGPKVRRPSQMAKRLKQDAGKESWKEIKEAVMARVLKERGERCEWCERPCEDAHHIISGSGKRRVFEAPDTVAGICRDCHRAYERADIIILGWALAWAYNHGFGRAHEEIRRRLDKACAIKLLTAMSAVR